MPAARTVLSLLIVVASVRAFAQDATSHDGPAHPAPVEGVWCFDVVQSGNAIHVLTGDVHAGKASLWYSRSYDGGSRWVGSVRLDTGLAAPQPLLLSDHARIAARGERLIAAWSADSTGAGGNVAVASSDSGRTWRARGDASDDGLSTRRDRVLVPGRDPSSVHGLVRTAIDGETGVYYRASADGGKTWRQAVRLAGTAARNPDLVRAPDGMLAAVWEEVSGPESTIFHALSLDDGLTWGPPAPLSDGGSEATHPRIVVTKSRPMARAVGYQRTGAATSAHWRSASSLARLAEKLWSGAFHWRLSLVPSRRRLDLYQIGSPAS